VAGDPPGIGKVSRSLRWHWYFGARAMFFMPVLSPAATLLERF
jgi:hypothetical protein